MTFNKYTILFACLFAIFPNIAFAEDTLTGLNAGVALLGATPQGDFADVMDNNVWAGNLFATVHIADSPVAAGINLAVGMYGRNEHKAPLVSTLVTVKEITTNSIFQGHLMLRLQPQHAAVRPYLDGLVGFTHLSTSTKVTDEDEYDDEGIIASSTNKQDTSFSYGIGGGVTIRLWQPMPQPEEDNPLMALHLDLGMRSIYTNPLTYLTEDSFTYNTDVYPYEVTIEDYHSRADIHAFYIGLVFEF